jgi:hypothetical protein
MEDEFPQFDQAIILLEPANEQPRNQLQYLSLGTDQYAGCFYYNYKITPEVISIVDTGLGKCSVSEDIEAVLRKIEYWHQSSISSFKIMCRDGKGFWHGVRWDDKTVSFFALWETDERMASKKLLRKG